MFNNIDTRISYPGKTANDRIINSKKRNFNLALTRSPQSDLLYRHNDPNNKFRGLVTPSQLKQDLNRQMISVDYQHGIRVGDTLHNEDSDTDWIIIYEHVDEKAYFRGEMILMDARLRLSNGEIMLVAKRSPVETATPNTQRENILFEAMNSSVKITLPIISEDLFEQLDRGKIIKLGVKLPLLTDEEGIETWREESYKVIARDVLVNGGIMEVYCKEYYESPLEEKREEEKIGDVDKEEPLNPIENPFIEGEFSVDGFDTDLQYRVVNLKGGVWKIDNNKMAKIVSQTEEECLIDILIGKSGKFLLKYETETETLQQEIKIKSL